MKDGKVLTIMARTLLHSRKRLIIAIPIYEAIQS